MASEAIRRAVLKEYPRAVVHVRRQCASKRFSLVLGAGMSRPFSIPLWSELIDNIAQDDQINGKTLIGGAAKDASFPYKTELLYQHFRKRRSDALGVLQLTRDDENGISADWLKICARHIYANCPKNFALLVEQHPYLKSLLPLVQTSHITINFNFDDFLEQALSLNKRDEDKRNRGFEIVTNPWPQFRRQDCVIYHPHGIFPQELMELPSDTFVFSEAGYANKYVGQDGVDSSFLLTHFARNTCLIVGCSLEDALRNVLMRGAYINPGNYHYYVHFLNEPSDLSEDEKVAIADTNFNVYNLVTLFLTSQQIDALLELINPRSVSDHELKDLAELCGVSLDYLFYLTGPMGVGKSTTTSLLRSLFVLDEWMEARPAILGKPWDQLDEVEREQADEWIVSQFGAKNDTLRHDAIGTISIVDRPPMDPLAFTAAEDRRKKAKALLDRLCPERKWEIARGTVILLTGDCKELATRLIATGRREYTGDKLEQMQQELQSIYAGAGVHTIETSGLSIVEVVKRVAQIVHRNQYVPFDLTAALKQVAEEV